MQKKSALRPQGTAKVLRNIQEYLLITVGALILAANVPLFLEPNKVISTGITGIGMLSHYLWGLPIGMVTLVLNIPLFILGIKWGGGIKFLIRTIFAVFVMTVAIDLFAKILPPIRSDPLIYTLFGGLLDGIGIGLVLQGRGTTGGTDIVAQLFNRHKGLPFGPIYIALNSVILLTAALVVSIEPVLYALIVNFVSGQVATVVQEGVSYARMVFVISQEHEAIREAVFNNLGRGITLLTAHGGYTKEPRSILYIVVSYTQITQLKRLIAEIDPQAFVVVSQAHEVLGEGFQPLREAG